MFLYVCVENVLDKINSEVEVVLLIQVAEDVRLFLKYDFEG